VLQDHPHHEDDQLELGSRNRERKHLVALDRGEVRLLDGESVILRRVVAEDELVMGVDVHQLPGRLVEPVGVEDPRHVLDGRRSSILESQAADDRGETLSVPATHQQVEVAVASGRAFQRVVALPVAVRDPLGGERLAQPGDESQRNGVPLGSNGSRRRGRYASQPATQWRGLVGEETAGTAFIVSR
jgi:hypothetical protein